MRNEKFRDTSPGEFLKIFQKFFEKLKTTKNFKIFKIFRDYTHLKEHSLWTPNMQILIFDHPKVAPIE